MRDTSFRNHSGSDTGKVGRGEMSPHIDRIADSEKRLRDLQYDTLKKEKCIVEKQYAASQKLLRQVLDHVRAISINLLVSPRPDHSGKLSIHESGLAKGKSCQRDTGLSFRINKHKPDEDVSKNPNELSHISTQIRLGVARQSQQSLAAQLAPGTAPSVSFPLNATDQSGPSASIRVPKSPSNGGRAPIYDPSRRVTMTAPDSITQNLPQLSQYYD
ncbi:MAG: hypothetical protein Q9191_006384 [Dirinaria sp. TL-2023a]